MDGSRNGRRDQIVCALVGAQYTQAGLMTEEQASRVITDADVVLRALERHELPEWEQPLDPDDAE